MNEPAVEKPRWADEVASYHEARTWLISAVHELPAGVLWGVDGADARQCALMLEGLEDFARQCARLQLADHTEFVEECRWHFEHWPHYLGRRRNDWEEYSNPYAVIRHGRPDLSPDIGPSRARADLKVRSTTVAGKIYR